MEWVQITTSDGHVLDGDLVVPDEPRSAVVLCHPHPQYGGSRHDHVVTALFEELPRRGHAALRFDFRRTYGGAIAERLDATAALDLAAERCPGVPLHLCGYSFGAIVALGTRDDRPDSTILVAPPLGVGFPDDPPTDGPVMVVAAEHDQFCPPAAVESVVADWPRTTVVTVTMADHFFRGRATGVVDAVVSWLDERT